MSPNAITRLREIIDTQKLYRSCYVSEINMLRAMNTRYPESKLTIPADRYDALDAYNEVIPLLESLLPE